MSQEFDINKIKKFVRTAILVLALIFFVLLPGMFAVYQFGYEQGSNNHNTIIITKNQTVYYDPFGLSQYYQASAHYFDSNRIYLEFNFTVSSFNDSYSDNTTLLHGFDSNYTVVTHFPVIPDPEDSGMIDPVAVLDWLNIISIKEIFTREYTDDVFYGQAFSFVFYRLMYDDYNGTLVIVDTPDCEISWYFDYLIPWFAKEFSYSCPLFTGFSFSIEYLTSWTYTGGA